MREGNCTKERYIEMLLLHPDVIFAKTLQRLHAHRTTSAILEISSKKQYDYVDRFNIELE